MSNKKPDKIQRSWAHDVVQLVAGAAMLYGVWQWSPPAAWVVGGLVALAASLYGQARS